MVITPWLTYFLQMERPLPDYLPPPLLRNPHVQSILASTAVRKLALRRHARKLLAATARHVLDCGDGVRLMADFTAAADGRRERLVTLIHGWEGSSESNYILSLAVSLHRDGYAVMRLNLRDHGPSHHLNRALFNSTRLAEVLGAMEAIQRQFPHRQNFLAGFSLGGNFALRIGADAGTRDYRFDRIVAVCPVIDPQHTMRCLEDGLWLYHHYFVRKWRRSLARKLELFPNEYDYGGQLLRRRTLRSMNEYFVPRYTDFDTPATYLAGYAVTGNRLARLSTPTHIVTSADDPVVHAVDLALLPPNPAIEVEVTAHGGHCGFLKNWRLESWIDERIAEILAAPVEPASVLQRQATG